MRRSHAWRGLHLRSAAPDEWDRAWRRSAAATFFESRGFSELWSSYTQGRCSPAPLLVALDEECSVVVPLTRQTAVRGLATVHLLGPASTYGGWLELSGRVGPRGAARLTELLTTQCGSLAWRANPYDSVALSAFPARRRIDMTQVIPLGSGIDAVLARWSKGHARSLRKSWKQGVTVRRADCLSDWRSYYRLYQESLERWADGVTMRYEWRLFALLAAMDPDSVRLWIASREGQDLAGVLCLASRHCVAYWHGASASEAFPVRAVHAALHRAMVDACESDAQWFDMNPSGGHRGVEDFKRGFGVLPLLSPMYVRMAGLPRLAGIARASSRRVAESVSTSWSVGRRAHEA